MTDWVSMRQASKKLQELSIKGSSIGNLSRLGSAGRIETRDDPLNGRVKLVHLPTLLKLFRREMEK